MSALEITLIIIGLAIIAASYMILERGSSDKEEARELLTVADYEKRKELEKGMAARFEAMSEEAINHVNASLCKLSNEKIMAVNEYGDMVLDRIDKNHSEVVFLYSMLTDKEKELKQLVSGVASTVSKEEVIQKLEALDDKKEMPVTSEEEVTKEEDAHLLYSQAKELHRNRPDTEETVVFSTQHDEILALLNKGKSVREVSKELDLGQGEVQLVSNLYAGGRK